ncbi:30S ribosomal protein S9 [Candidatus Marinamargulisbacteria bacterium SCGC AG-333-B06]|nr:30S ribosomal protein S9 [Candidatus Marinamargulisbacteria bacterium SCGC AG-333-B06]
MVKQEEKTKNKLLKVPNIFFYGTGKRKCAIAKVWLFEGNGSITVNNLNPGDYFGSDLDTNDMLKPLDYLGLTKKYNLKISVLGGGKSAQVDACLLGISRALLEVDSQFRQTLKENGCLTRDPRIKERKKYGLRRARKAPQYRKR